MAALDALIEELERSYTEMQERQSDPAVYNDHREAATVGRRLKELEGPYKLALAWRQANADLEAARADAELAEMVADYEADVVRLEEELRLSLVERDPADDKDVILEIRQGVGGDEAALWAGDLAKMLRLYAERRGFKWEELSVSPTEGGGLKEGVFAVKGDAAYSVFKYEGGTHRVQRVPATESAGRIHTSTATVAVMPEIEEVDVEIDESDLKIDVMRVVGPGGPVREHDGLRRPDHPPADRDRRRDAGRALAAPEPRAGDAGAPCAHLRGGAREAAGEAGGDAQGAGRDRGARREDPHLQLSAGPRHRPPGEGHGQARGRAQRRPRRADRDADLGGAPPRARERLRVTIAEALRAGSGFLERKGVDSPRLDAELLLGKALGLSRLELYTQHDRPLSEAEQAAARALLERRGRREPLAYVLGEWGFRRLTLATDARALVPRPETEIVVERALALLEGIDEPRVVDVGTGSGAIALALAQERPDAQVTATDVSPDALALARENAERLGLEVELVETTLLAGLAGPFDLVVSNPPYVAAGELDSLQPEVRDWEPRGAVVENGQTEELVRTARDVLATGGALVLECHEGKAQAVAELLRSAGYSETTITLDLAGRERVVEGRWQTTQSSRR